MGQTPAEMATTWMHQFDLTLQILEGGGDPSIYAHRRSNKQLAHSVVMEGKHVDRFTPKQRADYDSLLKWLVDHGVSIDDARADLARWQAAAAAGPERYRAMMDAEVAARKARAALKAAARTVGEDTVEAGQ